MKIFGFNITRSTPPPVTRSFDPAAWLTGRDLPTGPCLSNAYEQVVWVYRAINVIAEQIANIPFLFSRGERGRENLITSGPLLDFYAQPHPHINQFQYWELRIFYLMLRGECFRIPIYRDGAGHRSSLRHHDSRLESVLIPDPDRFVEIIDHHDLMGWRYTGSHKAPLESQVFLPEEVWFERLPSPFDFWRGFPPMSTADMPAKTDFAASSFMRGVIENNAETGLIVRSEQQLNEEQREQITSALRQRKRRAGAADQSVLLWGATEIVKPQLSSADLQFLENRKFSRAEICAAFGVPEEIITSTDHAKYDVMQGARLNFIENRIAPLCARLEAEEQKTIRAIDPNAVGWFDLDSLPIMQQARRSRLAAAKTGFDMGIPFNELNRVLDLGFPDLPHGNTSYLPSSLQPAGEGGKGRVSTLRSCATEDGSSADCRGGGEGKVSDVE